MKSKYFDFFIKVYFVQCLKNYSKTAIYPINCKDWV